MLSSALWKMFFTKFLLNKKKWMMLEIANKNVFKIMAMPKIWYLNIILCFVHSIWFVKYVFSTNIWFIKTWTKIIKYISRVVKLNPASIPPLKSLQNLDYLKDKLIYLNSLNATHEIWQKSLIFPFTYHSNQSSIKCYF